MALPYLIKMSFLIKHGAILINTSRGSQIDGQLPIQTLDNRKVYTAGSDIKPVRPDQGPLPDHQLSAIPSPVASALHNSRREIEINATGNIFKIYEIVL